MAGLYDLLPEGALTSLGFGANANQVAPQMTQAPEAPQSQGVLGFPDANAAFFGVARALAAAGSPDPIKAAMAFHQNDREAAMDKAKLAEIAREKRKPISAGVPGVFLQPTAGGGWETVVDPKAVEVAKALGENKLNDKVLLAILGKQLEGQVAGVKQDQKSADETRPLLAQTQQMFDGWNKAKEVVEGQAQQSPLMSKVQGALPGISGFLGGDQVANNKFLQGLTVDETLLNTARTKGAISDKEMELFKSPIPSLSDDREKVWKPYIEQRLPVIQKLMQFQQSVIDRGDNAASRIGANLPAAGGAAPKFVVPGLSEGASKYFSK